ncbi:glycosyltransferase family 2 protein [Zunongwangia sp. F363]|uniref:Glycosyltransferase family 2 protein n=1 Tax=Autumnicola tepida TaxID=3075595 RepID=A0ABU3C7G3_9FLAO|nr:glycosyltransferase family 2 protein [Zunongwangia sp. F363]MDT0642281.1 glycosyltransferase family 2 protein [Zunongwangia sp. F363]
MISIIVPIYNAENYLFNCIESILGQSYQKFQIILVDDGSTDNSLSICTKFASNDGRIKVLTKSNGGVSSARNAGLKNSTGKYILQIDADDILLDDALLELVTQAENNGSDIVIGDYIIENSSSKDIVRHKPIIDYDHLLLMILEGKVHAALWNKLISKKLFYGLQFEEGRDYMEDKLILIKILTKKPKVSTLHKTVYRYIQRETSYSNKLSSESFLAYEFVINQSEKLLSENPQFLKPIRNMKLSYKLFVLLNREQSGTGIANIFHEVNDEVFGNNSLSPVHKILLWSAINNFNLPLKIYRFQRALVRN